jgi:thiol-disulfide isomerase/thioredoxin
MSDETNTEPTSADTETETDTETERPDEAEQAEQPTSAGKRRSRTGLSMPILAASIVFSAMVGLFVAWLVIGSPTNDEPAISTKQFLGASADSPVQVSGTAAVGSPAPQAAFTYFQGMSGSLAALKGTPTVVNFWSSTCAPCVREMPSLQKLYQRLGGQQAQFLGIDVGDSLNSGLEMVAKLKVTYPQARDPKSQLVAAFGGTALPDTVLIDATGKIVAIYNRALTAADLADIPKQLGLG